MVWDPVLNATAGRLESADLQANLDRILAVTTVFTPNFPEALELSGFDRQKVKSEGMAGLGRFFLDRGATAVLIKGGHVSDADDATDVFISSAGGIALHSPKCKGDGAHGGGCALSSATAAYIARGFSLDDAVFRAKAYVYRGIVEPDLPYNSYRPPVGHHGEVMDELYLPQVEKLF